MSPNRLRFATLCALAALSAVPVCARKLTVGAGKTYAKPSLAAAAAKSGDTVEIDPGVYAGDACTWSADNLVIRAARAAGDTRRAVLRADGADAQGKGIWVVDGKNTTIEGIEFTGAKVPDENGAGIRQEGPGVTIRDCYFHDNENGILGAGDDMVIEYTEFAHNGIGEVGRTHNIYVSEGSSFTMRYCYSHHAVIGHNVKSRAAKNFILYNRIMDEADGTSSYDIDLPNGGIAVILGNEVQQGQQTDNSIIIEYGAEGLTHTANELYVVHNTVVNDRAGGTFFSVSGNPTVSKFLNNLLVGSGTAFSGTVTDTAGNVVSQSPGLVDRAGFDYRLASGSPAIDKGADPGTGAGMSLSAVSEYVHPLSARERKAIGKPDAGAYEFGTPGAIKSPSRRHSSLDGKERPGLAMAPGRYLIGPPVSGEAYDCVGQRLSLLPAPAIAP